MYFLQGIYESIFIRDEGATTYVHNSKERGQSDNISFLLFYLGPSRILSLFQYINTGRIILCETVEQFWYTVNVDYSHWLIKS